MTRGLRNLIAAISLAACAPLAAGCFGAMENVQTINDPFLGPTRGFVMYLDLMGYTGVSVKEAQGKYTLQVMVVHPGATNAPAAVGDKTEFLVGSKVEAFENAVEAQPVANHNGSTVFTQWQLTFKLDADQAKKFTAGPLGAIKAHVGSLEFQIAVAPEKGAKFQQNLTIMTSPPGAAPATAAK